jgi:hypothetical protein
MTFLLALVLSMYQHYFIRCWQIGDNIYNCVGGSL